MVTIAFDGCSQSKFAEDFLGRIYIIETQDAFFQFKKNNNATYYTIDDFGSRELSKHSASWTILKDTTLVLTVKYGGGLENAIFFLKYNLDGDYWLDRDMPSAYRRMKYVSYKDFYIEEF